MEIVEKNDETCKKQNDGDEEKEGDDGNDLSHVPLLEVIKAILAALSDLARDAVEAGAVFLDPLLYDDADCRRCEAENERDEPQSVGPDCVGRCEECSRVWKELAKGGLSRIHKQGGSAKGCKLIGYLGEECISLI